MSVVIISAVAVLALASYDLIGGLGNLGGARLPLPIHHVG